MDVVKITLKSLPSTIKRKETHIRKEQKIADDPSNPLAYSTQIIINVGRKNKVGLKKELQDLKQDREDLSKEMEQLQAKVLKSKADLKRAKQTEQFEDAKVILRAQCCFQYISLTHSRGRARKHPTLVQLRSSSRRSLPKHPSSTAGWARP